MSEKRPQPTAVLTKRLQRVARWLDQKVEQAETPQGKAQLRARVNTCWQAAARLELLSDPDAVHCEGCNQIATMEDDAGVPLCDVCYASLERV